MEVLEELRVNRERWASPEFNSCRKVLLWLDQERVGEGMVLEFRSGEAWVELEAGEGASPRDSVAGTVR